MTISIRKGTGDVSRALVAQYNLLRKTVATSATLFHCDVTSLGTTGSFESLSSTAATCSTANATDLATSIALANKLKFLFNKHAADSVAHLAADTTNGPIATADASDLTTVEALANALKTKFNAHLTQSGVHVNNDGANTVSAAAATDQTTSNTLLNAIKTAYNAHIASAPAGSSLTLVDP